MSSAAEAPATSTTSARERLAALIRARESESPGYWDFTDSPRRGGSHAFFQYPAMMVPELQGALLDDLLAADPTVRHVYDPFMGSGTVLLESIYRGLDFHGVDINPMAALLSTVKSNPPHEEDAKSSVTTVVSRARTTVADNYSFPNVDKWFQPEVRKELSQLRVAIQSVSDRELRRFLWVCMAETIRLVSNSRTSTVKLHAYSPEVLATRKPQAITMFQTIGLANAKRAGDHWERVRARDTDGAIANPTVEIQRSSILNDIIGPASTDAIMSSPPYGDNDTTVTYGQHSYLPLRWIPPEDLVGAFDPELLSSTARIDTLSLGGSLVGALSSRDSIKGKSASLAEFLTHIEHRPDLLKKVLSFSKDYEVALRRATRPLKVGGFSFWTLGERRVGGHAVPLVRITEEFLALHGHETVLVIDRVLPQKRKRMAAMNQSGKTMSAEHILISIRTR